MVDQKKFHTRQKISPISDLIHPGIAEIFADIHFYHDEKHQYADYQEHPRAIF